MKSENIIQTKSYQFAVKTVNLCRKLMDERKEYILAKQLLRSGTSIGANIEEAIGGHSEKDFLAKLTIAYKEARESKYWLNLLRDTNYLTPDEAQDLLNDLEEILRIIGSIQKTLKSKQESRNS
jgi:four helix bundle protein